MFVQFEPIYSAALRCDAMDPYAGAAIPDSQAAALEPTQEQTALEPYLGLLIDDPPQQGPWPKFEQQVGFHWMITADLPDLQPRTISLRGIEAAWVGGAWTFCPVIFNRLQVMAQVTLTATHPVPTMYTRDQDIQRTVAPCQSTRLAPGRKLSADKACQTVLNWSLQNRAGS